MNKNLLFYDVYERHKKIASYIGEGKTVLDVGGELNHLSQFSKPKSIVVANLNTGDVIIKKGKLPFKKESFDVVCAIDVLEHILKKDRFGFLENLIEVSRNAIVVSFPIGTKKHIDHETKMASFLKKNNLSIKYLEEHIKYGLPTKEEITSYVSGKKFEIVYSGNIKINELLFKIFVFDPKIPVIRKFVYFLKLFFNLISNQLLYLSLSGKKFGDNVNRAYLIIYK